MTEEVLISTEVLTLSRLRVRLEWYATLPSTNTLAKARAVSGEPEGLCIVADEQTAGRGRHERRWDSPAGEGVYLSLLLRPRLAVDRLPLVSLLGALAVARMVKRFGPELEVDIKWPNDVLIGGKKTGGILVEAGFAGTAFAVLGIGINLRQREFPTELRFPGTSLALELGDACPDQPAVVKTLLSIIDGVYGDLEDDPDAVVAAWEATSSYAYGKHVTIVAGDRTIAGVTRGIRRDGALMVETDEGAVEAVTAGDARQTRSQSGHQPRANA